MNILCRARNGNEIMGYRYHLVNRTWQVKMTMLFSGYFPGGRKDEKLGKGKAKNQISQKYAQDLLQMAPDLCYYGPIMIGGHWGSLE